MAGATSRCPEKDRYGYAQRYLLAEPAHACRRPHGRATLDRRRILRGLDGHPAGHHHRPEDDPGLGHVRPLGPSTLAGEPNIADSSCPSGNTPTRPPRIIDEEVKRLIDEAYAEATRVLNENWTKVEAIAEALLRLENP